ncbi:hypothetical protein AC249_AIPGENE20291 [Exaiptasia diaphana]|nr:hypothetical protein AC249_AIPGENE20291 [Exaiptasia diaphana]
MRADHDMPTVAQYGYRRSRCVEDNASHSTKHFSYFTGPNSHYPEKVICREPPNLELRKEKRIEGVPKEDLVLTIDTTVKERAVLIG